MEVLQQSSSVLKAEPLFSEDDVYSASKENASGPPSKALSGAATPVVISPRSRPPLQALWKNKDSPGPASLSTSPLTTPKGQKTTPEPPQEQRPPPRGGLESPRNASPLQRQGSGSKSTGPGEGQALRSGLRSPRGLEAKLRVGVENLAPWDSDFAGIESAPSPKTAYSQWEALRTAPKSPRCITADVSNDSSPFEQDQPQTPPKAKPTTPAKRVLFSTQSPPPPELETTPRGAPAQRVFVPPPGQGSEPRRGLAGGALRVKAGGGVEAFAEEEPEGGLGGGGKAAKDEVKWFPRAKTESYLERKIRILQEEAGPLMMSAVPHLSRIEREKRAAAESAESASAARRQALVEASWCRILEAAGISSPTALARAEQAEEAAANAVTRAEALGVVVRDAPLRSTPSSPGGGGGQNRPPPL